MDSLISVNCSALGGHSLDKSHAIGFGTKHSGQGASLALPGCNHDTARSGLEFRLAAVCTVFGEVGQANVTSKICPINLNFASQAVAIGFSAFINSIKNRWPLTKENARNTAVLA